MRTSRFALALPFLTTLASTDLALAQPPSHAKRVAAAAAPSAMRAAAPDAAKSAAAIAYMSGKQALVGLHGPSTRPMSSDDTGRPMLSLTTINRGESLAIPAANEDGGFASPDLDRVAHLLRAGSGDEHPVDPRALSILYQIETHFGVPEIRVVSGYRVPRPGSRSNHGKGRAVDLVVPGVADEEVARFARELGFVGVGVYPTSQFVHVDVRPRSYFWIDYSGPRMRNRERGILGDLAAQSDVAAVARGQVPIEAFAVATNVDAALQVRGLTATAAQPAEEDEDEE
jgi:uncharacterized protein YcbK (DUF882 family)